MRSPKLLISVLMPILVALLIGSCGTAKTPAVKDAPRLAPGTRLQDVTFRSASLDRDVTYRVVLPEPLHAGETLTAVYLLHGGAGNFRDWTNYSDVARFAASDRLDADDSYYMNSATGSREKYEDFVTKDLVSEVERRFPAAKGRSRRAIVGVSMVDMER